MSESTVKPTHPGQVQENWGEKRDKLKVQFPTLTDADLHFEQGKKDEMLAKVQTKLGKTKEELDALIEQL